MRAILASSSIQTYQVSFKDIGEPLCLELKLWTTESRIALANGGAQANLLVHHQ